jgi:hypothetical protein
MAVSITIRIINNFRWVRNPPVKLFMKNLSGYWRTAPLNPLEIPQHLRGEDDEGEEYLYIRERDIALRVSECMAIDDSRWQGHWGMSYFDAYFVVFSKCGSECIVAHYHW